MEHTLDNRKHDQIDQSQFENLEAFGDELSDDLLETIAGGRPPIDSRTHWWDGIDPPPFFCDCFLP